MAEIKLKKKLIYSGEVFASLMGRGWGCTEISNFLREFREVDAVEVVRCKDCRHWLPEEPERCKALKQEPYGLCNRYPQRTDWQDTTDHDDFCSYGEMRSDG